jgi:hypothetical protein
VAPAPRGQKASKNVKKIIDGKLYDTKKATEIGSDNYGQPGDFEYWAESLYVSASGRYFLAGEGGPPSRGPRSTLKPTPTPRTSRQRMRSAHPPGRVPPARLKGTRR